MKQATKHISPPWGQQATQNDVALVPRDTALTNILMGQESMLKQSTLIMEGLYNLTCRLAGPLPQSQANDKVRPAISGLLDHIAAAQAEQMIVHGAIGTFLAKLEELL